MATPALLQTSAPVLPTHTPEQPAPVLTAHAAMQENNLMLQTYLTYTTIALALEGLMEPIRAFPYAVAHNVWELTMDAQSLFQSVKLWTQVHFNTPLQQE